MEEKNAAQATAVVPPREGGDPEAAGDGRLLVIARVAFRGGRKVEPPAGLHRLFTEEFVGPVRQWCRAHIDQVRAVFLSVYEDSPAVFVVGSVPGYDPALSRPLADLEMDLHRRGWSCSVLQLPSGTPDIRRAFLDESRAVQVWPDPPGSNHAHSG
jgi:hypothetical protein